MSREQGRIAAVLADARAEALAEERPLSCAALNSVIDRLCRMFGEDDAAFAAEAFRRAANYRGMTDGTTGRTLLP